MVASGNVYINISWYLDVQLVNGIEEPINGTLMITPTGSAQELLMTLPYGKGSEIEVRERSLYDTYNPGGTIEHYSYDLLFEYEGSLGEQILLENISFSNYTYLYQMIDLQPIIDLPETIETDEDVWGDLPLDELIIDPDGDDLDIEAESDQNIHVNIIQGGSTLRFKNEIEHWSGTGWINLTVTWGENATYSNMTVIVQSINDAPYFVETPPELAMDEDKLVYFNFTGKVEDVEGSDIEISFPESDLYIIEYNETNMNATIWPADDLNGILEIEVNLSDGEETVFETLVINITPVNDAPVFNEPPEWNITMEKGNQTTINLTSMLFDVDGDELILRLDPVPYAFVDEYLLTVSIEDNYTHDMVQVFIIVSDGELGDTALLNIFLTGGIVADDDDDDDDDVNDTIGRIFIKPDEDSWNIEVEGEEGQTLYFVVEDSEGGRNSFILSYSDDKYITEIMADEANEGDEFWISRSENGEPIVDAPQGSLTGLKEEESDPFPIWIIILIIAILLIIIIAVIIAVTRGMGEYYEE
jgi:hypothetical protein